MTQREKALRAMKQLRDLGYIAYGGVDWNDIFQELQAKHEDPNAEVKGVVYWEREDNEFVNSDLGFFVGFTDDWLNTGTESATAACKVAEVAISVLEKNGLTTSWTGHFGDAIYVEKK